MKRFWLILGCLVATFAVAVYAESTKQKNTGAGLQIGTTSTQKIGVWGATPTNRLTVTVATNTLDDCAATIKGLIDALRVTGLVNTN